MDREQWADKVKIILPPLRKMGADEDAQAHACLLIPEFIKKNKPGNWRGTDDAWLIQQARRAANKYRFKETKQGIKCRNGRWQGSFMSMDEPLDFYEDHFVTLHDILPSYNQPDLWLEAEQVLPTVMRPSKKKKKGWRSYKAEVMARVRAKQAQGLI